MGHVPNIKNVKYIQSLTGIVEMCRIFRTDNVSVRIVGDEPAEIVATDVSNPTVPGRVFQNECLALRSPITIIEIGWSSRAFHSSGEGVLLSSGRIMPKQGATPVSYTHLDVYKRQR